MLRRTTPGMAGAFLFVALVLVGALSQGPAFGGKDGAPAVDHPAAMSPPPAPVQPCAGTADTIAIPPAEELNYCPAEAPVSASPDWAAKPHRHGYCRCSCGYPCQSDADCGGASCDPFITCC